MSIFNSPKFDPLGNSSQVGATNMNKISVAQDAATLRAGVGTRMQYTPSGMVISTVKKRKASATIILNLVIVSGSELGKYKITDGVVNSETPTLGGVDIGGETDPFVPIPEFTVTTTTYAWIKCVGVFGTPDTFTVTIETIATGDVPPGTDISATGFTSFYKIGRVNFTAGAPAIYEIVNQHGGGNIGVDSWGLYNLWWRA
jgi:hypothetical protein